MSEIEQRLREFYPFGFPISRQMLQKLQLVDLLDDTTNETQLYRELSHRLGHLLRTMPAQRGHIPTGTLVTAGIIVDVLRYILQEYCFNQTPHALPEALDKIAVTRGSDTVTTPSAMFSDLLPPAPKVKSNKNALSFLADSTAVGPNRLTIAGETILLNLININPAYRDLKPLFSDIELKEKTAYLTMVGDIEAHFESQPPYAPLDLPLMKALRAPMEASPDSLEGQLDYIRTRWSFFLPKGLVKRVLHAVDVLKEEQRRRGWGGPGPSLVPDFAHDSFGGEIPYGEPEAFSRDADWMANVVLLAKTAHVWLDQLSKKYQRSIRILSDIPDEELDRLARWGFTGLWIIGLWERSVASQTIKQIMGNPEAAPSAYSLYDYDIAADLGGSEAYNNLKERAARRGIRLASDMVPNHMGIYSRWVIEHPDWFVQTRVPPYSAYNYTGVNLSHDERVVLQIEDGYWEQRDAAVVFKRIDSHTGDVRYIYHGNDGTSTPWNDTAQLNFMMAEVREAVIQTILHVARMFPIIRFDAAMTLAKRHYQRLWFPKPGDGGAIPSRSDYSMTQAEFDAAFPVEFWREVVDRVAAEVPDTLLLAEAFWLMEGYFVRTLGMHRVYNSAFMNMLRDEDNAKYRQTIKNVLEFSPQVLKRFVNFMNNPDEATAIAQFGNGDKYFGVAVMMCTMPGLPMFGHGQVEGLTEKYGMEYRRAYWDETPDEEMVRRHEREIFPLIKLRYLFSNADNFALFDFETPDGWIDENVFAYTNRAGSEKAVILYNNSYDTTRGRIMLSTAINRGTSDHQVFVRKSLTEALEIDTRPGELYKFRDHRTGLWYLRYGDQLANEGLHVELQGFQYCVFLNFEHVDKSSGAWDQIAAELGQAGCPSLERELERIRLEPVLAPWRALLEPELLKHLDDDEPHEEFVARVKAFRRAVENFTDRKIVSKPEIIVQAIEIETDEESEADLKWISALLVPLTVLSGLEARDDSYDYSPRHIFNAWWLRQPFAGSLSHLVKDHSWAEDLSVLVSVMFDYHTLLLESERDLADRLTNLFDDHQACVFLDVNEHEGHRWFNKERMGFLVMMLIASQATAGHTEEEMTLAAETASEMIEKIDQSKYRVDKLIALFRNEPSGEASDEPGSSSD